MNIKEIIRWTTIAASTAFGIYGLYGVVLMMGHSGHSWFSVLFLTLFGGFVVAVPLAIAFFVFRRRYDSLISMLIGVGAVAAFFMTSHLLRAAHVDDLIFNHLDGSPWTVMIQLAITILTIFLPFLAASRFLRFGHWLYGRYRLNQRTRDASVASIHLP